MFDPYHKWLGIPPEDQPPNQYRLLGIRRFENDPDVIEAAADQRTIHLRNYQAGQHVELSQRLLNEVAAARVCLLDAGNKAAYDRQLKSQGELKIAPPISPTEEDAAWQAAYDSVRQQSPAKPRGEPRLAPPPPPIEDDLDLQKSYKRVRQRSQSKAPPPVPRLSTSQVQQEAELTKRRVTDRSSEPESTGSPRLQRATTAGEDEPRAMTEFGKYILATVACGAIFLLYVIACVFFGWERGGGLIPMLIFFGAVTATWKAITGAV